jgi:pSer/pThr/pTyr-binding forkhead associated (FHA) protein
MQGHGSYRLIVRRGPQPNQTFELSKDSLTLGRDITNDIVLNDPEVSRHHLRLTRTSEGFNLEDLGSTNGTFVNGQRVTGVRQLNRGDMIGLGETVTLGYDQVREAGESAPPPAQPGPQQQPPPQQQPQQQPPQQQPYSQPQPGYEQQPAYQQQEYEPEYEPPQPDYGYGAPQAPPGYDYDPYAIREEEPQSPLRWVAIGCAVLTIFCCCSSIVGLVIIDALNLWYDLPIIRSIAPVMESIARALGLV